jgi:L-serine dehydratase
MKAAGRFAATLAHDRVLARLARVHVELLGSLGAPGHGHGSVPATG